MDKGFLYKTEDDKTYIITNHHVVDGGDAFKVTYTNGDVEVAELLGGDQYADIAVLEVDTKEDFEDLKKSGVFF